MPIFVGGSEIKDIKIGNTEINEVYVGANKVWERALSFVITNDYSNYTTNFSYGTSNEYTRAGFDQYSAELLDQSSISPSPATFELSTYTGSAPTILHFYFRKIEANGTGTTEVDQVELWVIHDQDETVSNDGWTSVTIGNTTLNRASASYTNYPVLTLWVWDNVGNPFGTTVGASVDVKFTPA